MEAIAAILECRFYQMRILNAVSFNYSFYFSSVRITGSGSELERGQRLEDLKWVLVLNLNRILLLLGLGLRLTRADGRKKSEVHRFVEFVGKYGHGNAI